MPGTYAPRPVMQRPPPRTTQPQLPVSDGPRPPVPGQPGTMPQSANSVLGGQDAQSQNPLGPWTNWMTSGGTNPGNWQNLSGTPNTGFLDMSHWTQGGADPTRITPTDPQHGYDQFIDNAYQQSARQLDPQWQAQQTQFDQDMVNRGIAPGSQAYITAKSQFDQGKNDAYAQARAQAQQQGLAAQGQSFGQGLQSSQLSSALAQALIGANSQYAGQQLGGNASIMNQLLGGNSGLAQALIGAQASNLNAGLSAGAANNASQNQYNLGMANLNQNGQQMDFGNLMTLLNMGQGTTQYNNNLLNMDQQRQQSMYGGLPSSNGGNLDVQNPYNNQYNGQMNQWNYQNQQANSQNQQYAQWAQLLASMYGGGG